MTNKEAIEAIKEAYCNTEYTPSVTSEQKYEDISKAFQFGLAIGFGTNHDEMDRVINEMLPKGDSWRAGYKAAMCDVMRIVDDADEKAGDKTYIVLDDGSFYSQVKYIKEKMSEL